MGTDFEEEVRQHHLGVTFFYLATTTLLGHLLRGVVRKHAPAPYCRILLDCISTLQLCSCTWENGFTFRTHGFYALLFQIFCLVNVYKFFFYDSTPNPLANLAKYFQGERPLLPVCVTIVLQMLAGQLSFYYAQCMWWLELSPAYSIRRADLAMPCVSDLQVTVFQGMLLEGVGCFVDRVFGLKQWTRREGGEHILQALLGTLLTGAGLQLTGMYINPANASSQGFGCAGSSWIGHILVYWIAPSLGCFFSVQIKKKYFHNEVVHFVHDSTEDIKDRREVVNGLSHTKRD